MEWQGGGGPVYIWGSARVYRQRWRAERSTECRSESGSSWVSEVQELSFMGWKILN